LESSIENSSRVSDEKYKEWGSYISARLVRKISCTSGGSISSMDSFSRSYRLRTVSVAVLSCSSKVGFVFFSSRFSLRFWVVFVSLVLGLSSVILFSVFLSSVFLFFDSTGSLRSSLKSSNFSLFSHSLLASSSFSGKGKSFLTGTKVSWLEKSKGFSNRLRTQAIRVWKSFLKTLNISNAG